MNSILIYVCFSVKEEGTGHSVRQCLRGVHVYRPDLNEANESDFTLRGNITKYSTESHAQRID